VFGQVDEESQPEREHVVLIASEALAVLHGLVKQVVASRQLARATSSNGRSPWGISQ
jgi:hypothetical protein